MRFMYLYVIDEFIYIYIYILYVYFIYVYILYLYLNAVPACAELAGGGGNIQGDSAEVIP